MKYPLSWIAAVKAKSRPGVSWRVMLDAAAYVPTQPLDLSAVHPDFVSMSFYKARAQGGVCVWGARGGAALAHARRLAFALWLAAAGGARLPHMQTTSLTSTPHLPCPAPDLWLPHGPGRAYRARRRGGRAQQGALLAAAAAPAPAAWLQLQRRPPRRRAVRGRHPPRGLAPLDRPAPHTPLPSCPQMFWGGGSVALATSADDFHVLKCRPSERLEDGTVNFLDIASLRHGFALMQDLGGINAIQVRAR